MSLDFSAVEKGAEESVDYELSKNIAEDLVKYSRGNDGVCHACDSEYKNVWIHWGRSDCPHPNLDQDVVDIVTGLLMGDGSLRNRSGDRNAYLQLGMTNVPYLYWLIQKLGWMFGRVHLRETGEQVGRRAKESGFSPNADVDSYRDVYQLKTHPHPQFNQLKAWYVDGQKHFPEDLEINSTIVKHWYVSDGSVSWGNYRGEPSLRISTHVAVERKDMFSRAFSGCGFSPSISGKTIRFSVEESSELLEWMGEPPLGFEYKWETDSHEKYQQMKNAVYGGNNE